jgi:hypothetical protein
VKTRSTGPLIVAGSILPLLALAVVLAMPAYPISGDSPVRPLTPLQPPAQGTVLDQSLTAQYDNISAVGISFATFTGRSTGTVQFQLASASGVVIREATLNVADLRDVLYTRIGFAPVAGGSRTTLHVRLLFDGPRGVLPVTVMTAPPGPTETPLSVDGLPSDVVMPIHSWYGSSTATIEALPTILSRASQYKPGWLKVPWLWAWMILSVLLTFGALLVTAGAMTRRSRA